MVSIAVRVRITSGLSGRALQRAWNAFTRRARIVLSQDTAERFETSTAPDGQAWAPLKSTTRNKAVLKAIGKVGGRKGRPVVNRTRRGGLIVRARNPQPGFQKTARVRRTQMSKILIDTGRLRASVVVNAASADAIRQQRAFRFEWGTRVPYARKHQFGDPQRNLPPRPFLGVSQNARQQLLQQLQRAVHESMQ